MNGSDIAHIAALARIEMEPAEMDAIAADLSSVLAYVGTISEIADTAPMNTLEHKNVFRSDEVLHTPGEYTVDLVTNAPQSEDGYVVVKKIL